MFRIGTVVARGRQRPDMRGALDRAVADGSPSARKSHIRIAIAILLECDENDTMPTIEWCHVNA